jgi:hypothetical protein
MSRGLFTVTALHQAARRLLPLTAPRLDVLGMRSLARGYWLLGRRAPKGRRLYRQTLVGDLLANSLYDALVAVGRSPRPLLRGTLLGGLAGVGAVVLPPRLALGRLPTRRSAATRRMSVLWYLLGGLAAAATARGLGSR